jgi:hypothetical protein
MIDASTLLADLGELLSTLEDDLRERCAEVADLDATLREEYAGAKGGNRTAEA